MKTSMQLAPLTNKGQWIRRPILWTGLFFLVFEMIIIVYAFWSPRVTTYHFFYNMKQTLEQWYLASADSPVERIERYQFFSKRRLKELTRLVHLEQNSDQVIRSVGFLHVRRAYSQDVPPNPVNETVESVVQNIFDAADVANTIPEPEVFVEAIEIIIETEQMATETLQTLAGEIGIAEEALDMGGIADGIEKLETFDTILQEVEQNVSEEGNLIPTGQIFPPLEEEVQVVLEEAIGFEQVLVAEGVDETLAEQFEEKVEELAAKALEFYEDGNFSGARELAEKTDALMEQAELFIVGEIVTQESEGSGTTDVEESMEETIEPPLNIVSKGIEDFTWAEVTEEFDGLSWQIVAKNRDGQVIEHVTSGASPHRNPDGNRSFLVWQTLTENGWEIVGKPENGAEIFITQNVHDDTEPQTDGSWIVWQGQKDANWQVFLYGIVTKQTVILSTEGNTAIEPMIESGLVTWKEWEGDGWVMKQYP